MTNFETLILQQIRKNAESKILRVMKSHGIFTATVEFEDDAYIISAGTDWKGLSVEIFSEEHGRQLMVEDPSQLLIWLSKEREG